MDAPVAVGQTVSVIRRVTEDIYRAFVTCSGDTNPLHADDVYARQQGYPGKLMHGAILNAFVSGLVGTSLPTSDTMCLSQKVNFKRPFFLPDEVVLDVCVESIQGAPTQGKWIGVLKLKFRVRDKVIATGEVEVMLGMSK